MCSNQGSSYQSTPPDQISITGSDTGAQANLIPQSLYNSLEKSSNCTQRKRNSLHMMDQEFLLLVSVLQD